MFEGVARRALLEKLTASGYARPEVTALPSTPPNPDEAPAQEKHGIVATWWDAVSEPSCLAASLAKGEPRVHPAIFAIIAITVGSMLVVAVTRLQLGSGFEELGLSAQLRFIERFALVDHAAHLGLHLLAMLFAAWLFAFSAKLPLRDVLRARAYTLGPISHLYAWWTMYRWLREVQPAARRPEAWALMSFTLEWGVSLVLAHHFGPLLRDALLDFVPLS